MKNWPGTMNIQNTLQRKDTPDGEVYDINYIDDKSSSKGESVDHEKSADKEIRVVPSPMVNRKNI